MKRQQVATTCKLNAVTTTLKAKKSILMLAMRVSLEHSEEAEDNESMKHCNETTGREIACAMCHYNDKHELIGENLDCLWPTASS